MKKFLFYTIIFLLFIRCTDSFELNDSKTIQHINSKNSTLLNEGEKSYANLEEIKEQVNSIFYANKSEISQMIREIRPNTTAGYSDDELYVMQNCGPASIAFQKILIDNNIWAEIRTNEGPYKYHEYLLYRAPMTDGTFMPVIIDATYKQFFRNYAAKYLDDTNDSLINTFILSDEIKEYISDDILIVKDRGYLDEYYNSIFDSLLNSEYTIDNYYQLVLDSIYEPGVNPDADLQVIYTRYLDNATIEELLRISKERSNQYSYTYERVYLRGTFNQWESTAMTLVADNTWQTTVTFGSSTSERFKFDIYGDWSLNFGDNDSDGIADQNGSDIYVQPGSTYEIYFNDITKSYNVKLVTNSFASSYDIVYLRGTFNNWETTIMTLVADNTWQTTVTFGSSTSERFKFDIYGDWSLNFGDNDSDGIADQNGSDITVSMNSSYKITFNDITKKYTYEVQ